MEDDIHEFLTRTLYRWFENIFLIIAELGGQIPMMHLAYRKDDELNKELVTDLRGLKPNVLVLDWYYHNLQLRIRASEADAENPDLITLLPINPADTANAQRCAEILQKMDALRKGGR